MADILYLHCRNCGTLLGRSHLPYCDPCNMDLAYRALPFILGLLLLGCPAPARIPRHREQPPPARHLPGGYDDENALAWE